MKRLVTVLAATAILLGAARAKASGTFATYPITGCANDVATDGVNLYVIGCDTQGNDHGIYYSNYEQTVIEKTQTKWAPMPGAAQYISAGSFWQSNQNQYEVLGNSLSVVNSANNGFFFSSSVGASGTWEPYQNTNNGVVHRIANSYFGSNTPYGAFDVSPSPAGAGQPGGNSVEWALLGTQINTGDWPIAYRVYSATNPNVWNVVSGDAVEISVGPDTIPFVVNEAGDVYYWNSGFTAFTPWPGHGAAYAIASDSSAIYNSGGVVQSRYISVWIVGEGSNVNAPHRLWHYTGTDYTSGTWVQHTTVSNPLRVAAGRAGLQELAVVENGSGVGNVYYAIDPQ